MASLVKLLLSCGKEIESYIDHELANKPHKQHTKSLKINVRSVEVVHVR